MIHLVCVNSIIRDLGRIILQGIDPYVTVLHTPCDIDGVLERFGKSGDLDRISERCNV
jgi:hypothetical protein